MKDIFVKLGDVFTDDQIKSMVNLLHETDAVTRIYSEVMVPSLDRINMVTGQENDPMFWAYAAVYALDSQFNSDAWALGNQAQ